MFRKLGLCNPDPFLRLARLERRLLHGAPGWHQLGCALRCRQGDSSRFSLVQRFLCGRHCLLGIPHGACQLRAGLLPALGILQSHECLLRGR